MHYPGYNYLGPGTDLSRKSKPINSLDKAAKKHDNQYQSYLKSRASKWDIYTRNSKADDDFIRSAANTPFSIERELATGIFRGKRALNRFLGRSPVDSIIKRRKLNRVPQRSQKDSIIKGGKPNNNMKYLLGKRSRGRRMRPKRRFKKRRRTNIFRTVMNIMNPIKIYKYLNFNRVIGTINRRNYVHLTNVTINDDLRPPGGFYQITDAITHALGLSNRGSAANWNNTENYYVSQFFHWKISNNSNVQNKATLYWITVLDNTAITAFQYILDPDAYDNTEYYPNNATIDAVEADATTASNPNMLSQLHYNPFSDKLLLSNFRKKFKVKRGMSMVFSPGQTKNFTYKKKFKRFCHQDLFYTDNNIIPYPRGTIFPILCWEGDILPGTKSDEPVPYTVLASGVNRGDWSWQMQATFRVQQKLDTTTRTYINANTSSTTVEATTGDLKCFGFDNNDRVTAV